jgi:anti-sigma factor RsiW
MTSDKHVSAQDLEALFSGCLSDAAADVVIAHLAACDHCLAFADNLWAEAADLTIPDLDLERATRVEGRLRRNINRSNLGGQVIRFGTQGLLRVWWGLLAPFFGAGK